MCCCFSLVADVTVHARVIDGKTSSSSNSRVVASPIASSSSLRPGVDVTTGGTAAARRLQAVIPSAASSIFASSASEERRLVEAGARIEARHTHFRGGTTSSTFLRCVGGLGFIFLEALLHHVKRLSFGAQSPGVHAARRAASVPSACVPDETVIIVQLSRWGWQLGLIKTVYPRFCGEKKPVL